MFQSATREAGCPRETENTYFSSICWGFGSPQTQHVWGTVILLAITSSGYHLVRHYRDFPAHERVCKSAEWGGCITKGALVLLPHSSALKTHFQYRFRFYWIHLEKKPTPVNLVWKKVWLVCWLGSGQGGAGLMDGKHPNKTVEVWEPGRTWVQTHCYTPLAGRPLVGHLTSLCSNKPNCKFVYKLKNRCCIWEELAQAKILNSHLQGLSILL